MFAENVEVVRRLLAAFNGGDFGALNELDAGPSSRTSRACPGAGWNYGHEGAVDWARKLRQSFGELSFTIDEPSEAGGCVVTHWRAEGEGKRSGAKVAMAGYCVFDLARRQGAPRRVLRERARRDSRRRCPSGIAGSTACVRSVTQRGRPGCRTLLVRRASFGHARTSPRSAPAAALQTIAWWTRPISFLESNRRALRQALHRCACSRRRRS